MKAFLPFVRRGSLGGAMLALALGLATGADADPWFGGSPVNQSWYPQGRASLSVSSASSSVALPTGQIVNVCNTGSVDAYAALGGSSVTTTTGAGYIVKAGTCKAFQTNPFGTGAATYIAGITASSTTTFYIEGGLGTPPKDDASTAGTGITVNQGTSPWVTSSTNFPATVSTGTGAQGASSPRVTVATDSATVAGSTTLPAGANIIGKVGIDQTTPGTTNGTTSVAGTAGGAGFLCQGQIKATATACGTAAAHTAYLIDLSCALNSATSYAQIFDALVGNVTLGVTTGTNVEIQPGGHVVWNLGSLGWSFANQITIAFTTTATGSSAPANNCAYNVLGK